MKRTSLASEIITNQCVRWYRRHGNNCDVSVWKLIKLVKGYHGMVKMDESELIRSAYYATKIPSDISSEISQKAKVVAV